MLQKSVTKEFMIIIYYEAYDMITPIILKVLK